MFRRTDVLPGSGSLAFSIRGSSDAHLAICEGQNVIDSFCFFIIIGGWKNTRSVIRKCENGLPESASQFPIGDCAHILVDHVVSIHIFYYLIKLTKLLIIYQGQVLSSEEWRHFVLKWNFEDRISIKIFDINSTLLDYHTPKNQTYFTGERTLNGYNNRYYLHARTSGQILMKPHVCKYTKKKLQLSILNNKKKKNIFLQLVTHWQQPHNQN